MIFVIVIIIDGFVLIVLCDNRIIIFDFFVLDALVSL